MRAQMSRLPRIRLMIDLFLLIAVIVVLLAYYLPGKANAGQGSQAQTDASENNQNLGQPYPADSDVVVNGVISNTVILDDNTLAALLAAQNAALTPPQYLISLPAITR